MLVNREFSFSRVAPVEKVAAHCLIKAKILVESVETIFSGGV